MIDQGRVLATSCVGLFVAAFVAACSSGKPLPPHPNSPRIDRMTAAASSSAYSSTVSSDGPRQYFQLDETSGPAAHDSSSGAADGSYVGRVTYGAPGPLLNAGTTAIALAGGTSSAGVSLPNPMLPSGSSFSIETWVYPLASSGYMAIWGYSGTHRLLLSGSGQLLSQFHGNFFSKSTLVRNRWHQVVFVYDATAQQAGYYIDGTLDSSTPLPAAYATFNSGYYAGQYDTGTWYKWNGSLGQFSFYAAALTAAQIANHYAAAGYGASTATPAPAPTPSAPASCSGFRWPVKTATDSDASSIVRSPVRQTSIAALSSLTPPPSLTASTPRTPGAETTVYQLTNVTLKEAFREHDNDYHLLVSDGQGHEMISEVPDPACATNSALYDLLSNVRNALDAEFPSLASGASVAPDVPVTEQGVGFFDQEDVTSGESPNGIELHTLTSICFGTNCAGESYALDESGGQTAYDSSGDGLNGAYVGAVKYGAPGPLKNGSSSAIALAGGTASAGVSVPAPGASAGLSYSIEVWAYPSPSNTYMALWGYSGTHRLLLSASGQLLSQLDGNFFSKGALSRNAWHQIVFVYDAPSQTASYYIDGAFDSSETVPNSTAAFRSAYYLGQYDTGPYYKWNGRLARAAFYRSALTGAQIEEHYGAAGY